MDHNQFKGSLVYNELFSITPKSKIGSLDKISHKPGGGNVKIQNQRIR